MILMFTQDLWAALFLTARRGELLVRASEFDNEFINVSGPIPSELSRLCVRETLPRVFVVRAPFQRPQPPCEESELIYQVESVLTHSYRISEHKLRWGTHSTEWQAPKRRYIAARRLSTFLRGQLT